MHLFLAVMALMASADAPSSEATQERPPAPSPALSASFPELAGMPDVILVGYPVSGRSPRSIRESINAARPGEPGGGGRFDAVTTWRYSTRSRGSAGGGCDPATAEVHGRVVVTLPELTTRSLLNRRERDAWDRYLTRLVAHEQNHVRIALASFEQMRTAMRSAPDCPAMQAARLRIDASIHEANRQYDASTRHGATEGARYP